MTPVLRLRPKGGGGKGRGEEGEGGREREGGFEGKYPLPSYRPCVSSVSAPQFTLTDPLGGGGGTWVLNVYPLPNGHPERKR